MSNEKDVVVKDGLLDRLIKEVSNRKRLDVVRAVGVSQSTFSRWKNKQVRPSGLARVNLERVLNLMQREGRATKASKPVASDDVW